MPVTFKTNDDIFHQQLVNCVNAICALRNQLNENSDNPLSECVRQSIETSIVNLTTRLDALATDSARWRLPKLDNQDIASKKFDQEFRMAEYALWVQEVNKQVAMGNLMYRPGFEPPWMSKQESSDSPPPTVNAEEVPPPAPRRKKKKK